MSYLNQQASAIAVSNAMAAGVSAGTDVANTQGGTSGYQTSQASGTGGVADNATNIMRMH